MISITHACSACGFQWKSGENGAHDCSKNLRVQREDLQRDFLDLRNRAELAEKSALDLKAIADHLQRQRAETEVAHSRIYDEKNKEIAELQARMTRYERLLEDAEGNAETLRKAYDEAKNRADSTTSGKTIADLQSHLSAHQAQIAELTRQREEAQKDAVQWKQRFESANRLLRTFGHDITGTNPVTKDEQGAASNPPGAGKTPLDNYPQAPPRAEIERTLDACERENERLRLVIDSIQNILSLADEQ